MLDAQYANVYYNDSLAGTHLVYPTNGRRLDNNQIWGSYETFNNYSDFLRRGDSAYYGYCSNGNFLFYWWEAGNCIAQYGYRGGGSFYNMSMGTSCWNTHLHNNIKETFGNAQLGAIAPSCYKIIKGWH